MVLLIGVAVFSVERRYRFAIFIWRLNWLDQFTYTCVPACLGLTDFVNRKLTYSTTFSFDMAQSSSLLNTTSFVLEHLYPFILSDILLTTTLKHMSFNLTFSSIVNTNDLHLSCNIIPLLDQNSHARSITVILITARATWRSFISSTLASGARSDPWELIYKSLLLFKVGLCLVQELLCCN